MNAVRSASHRVSGSAHGVDLSGFVRLIVRIAHATYRQSTTHVALSNRVDAFMQTHLSRAHTFASDSFRAIFMSVEVQKIVTARARQLQEAFACISAHKSVSGRSREKDANIAQIGDYFEWLKGKSLVTTRLSIPRLTYIWFASSFEEAQADGWADWDWSLTQAQFSEAVVRIAYLHGMAAPTIEASNMPEIFSRARPSETADATMRLLNTMLRRSSMLPPFTPVAAADRDAPQNEIPPVLFRHAVSETPKATGHY